MSDREHSTIVELGYAGFDPGQHEHWCDTGSSPSHLCAHSEPGCASDFRGLRAPAQVCPECHSEVDLFEQERILGSDAIREWGM